MRLRIIKLSLFCFLSFTLLITLFTSNYKVNAKSELNNAPYATYTIGLEGNLTESPLAYEPVLVLNPGFNSPTDIFIHNNIVYITDKGNKVLWTYDQTSKQYARLGEGILSGPTGVYVTDENIYIADNDLKCIFKFDFNGNVVKKYERPVEPLFGERSEYRPTKVAVDRRGDLYITSDGNDNGVIQINDEGEFVGYFGRNTVNLTISLFFKRLMLPKEERETYASLKPAITTNLTIDDKNVVYTTIDNFTGQSIKKFNANGTNIFGGTNFLSDSYKDISIDQNGFVYTVSNDTNGVVRIYDVDGTLLFAFGSTKLNSFTLGEFDKAVGISVDAHDNIWVLDGNGNNIQVFKKTEFAQTVFNGILSYNEGNYDDAKFYYNEILKQNASFVNAYIGLGNIAQRLEQYDEAIEYFKIANYKSGYSDVYWELRDNFIGKYLILFVILIVIFIGLHIFKVLKKLKTLIMTKYEDKIKKVNEVRFVDELKYLGRILVKPFDVFYDIKFLLKIRTRSALIVLLMFIFVNIFGSYFLCGYLFRPTSLANVNFALELLKWGLIIIIFVFANYLISTLQSGEGFFRDILIGAIYAFAPVILFKLPLDLVSNVLTFNEAYIYNLAISLLWIWSIFNIIIMLKEIHNYSLKELIINIILTIVAVVILVLLYLVLYILTMQLFDFIVGLFREGGLRS